MVLRSERKINSWADVGGKRCVPRCASALSIHQLGRVLIVSFVEETGELLIFSLKYLGCRIWHVNKRIEVVVDDLHYSGTRVVLPSQSRCCPPKVHLHVPCNPARLSYCNFTGIASLWEVFSACVF